VSGGNIGALYSGWVMIIIPLTDKLERVYIFATFPTFSATMENN